MAERCAQLLADFRNVLAGKTNDELENDIFHREEELDVIQHEVSAFLGQIMSTNLPADVAYRSRMLLRVADEYESVSDEVAAALAACDALVLESNHDRTMLRCSGRPFALISRIAGDSGHLSNDQACEAVARCASPSLRALILAHLSEECNQPDVARACMARALKARGLAPLLAVAEQSVPLPFLEV